MSCPALCIAVMSLCQGLIMLSKRHCLLGNYNCVSGNRVAPSGHRCVKWETVVGALWLTAAMGGVRKPELSFFFVFRIVHKLFDISLTDKQFPFTHLPTDGASFRKHKYFQWSKAQVSSLCLRESLIPDCASSTTTSGVCCSRDNSMLYHVC